MSHYRVFLCALVLALAPVAAQTATGTIAISDGDPSSPDNTWGVALHPDGHRAYVSACGSLSTNNDDLHLVDLDSGTIQATATVGLFPEDVALVLDAQGNVREVYVANSTSGSVSAVAPDLSSVVTIPLPGCGSSGTGSAYPFGILASPDGKRVVVATTGCDRIALIDSDPASATYRQVVANLAIPGSHGRPVWIGPGRLLVPTTRNFGNYAWSEAGFTLLDLANPAGATWTPVMPMPFPGTFDNATDAAVLPDGRVLMTVGFGQAGRLVEIDPALNAVTRYLDLTFDPGVLLHGLAVDPTGTLAVVTAFNLNSSLAFVDVSSFSLLSTLPLGTWLQPNEVVFTRDAQRLLVTSQGAAQLTIVSDLPLRRLSLQATPTMVIGQDPFTSLLSGIEEGRPAAIYASIAGPGPTIVDGFTVYLTAPYDVLSQHSGSLEGEATDTIMLGPALSYLSGLTFYLQAATVDASGRRRLSNPVMTTLY